MSTDVAANGSGRFAARSLLGLELVAFATGAAMFAFAPERIGRPGVAMSALVLLAVVTLMTRLVPVLSHPPARQQGIAVCVLFVSLSALIVATGGLNSPLLTSL